MQAVFWIIEYLTIEISTAVRHVLNVTFMIWISIFLQSSIFVQEIYPSSPSFKVSHMFIVSINDDIQFNMWF